MTTASPISAENRSAAAAFDGVTQPLRGRRIAQVAVAARRGPWGGLPIMALLIVMGLATLAACVWVPLREERRQLQYAFDDLIAQREYVAQQSKANQAFITRVQTDPALAERLTMRFTRRPADGKKFLEGIDDVTANGFDSSPYSITQIAPPAAREPYESDLPMMLAKLMGDTKSRVILMGAALFLIAAAVVLGKEEATAPRLAPAATIPPPED